MDPAALARQGYVVTVADAERQADRAAGTVQAAADQKRAYGPTDRAGYRLGHAAEAGNEAAPDLAGYRLDRRGEHVGEHRSEERDRPGVIHDPAL